MTIAALLMLERSSDYPPLATCACLCAQPDIGRLTQASAPLGAMASRSMECCPAPLVLASNSPVGSREVFTISLPEILHRRAALRLVPPPTAHACTGTLAAAQQSKHVFGQDTVFRTCRFCELSSRHNWSGARHARKALSKATVSGPCGAGTPGACVADRRAGPPW